jgi:hypothetical protein
VGRGGEGRRGAPRAAEHSRGRVGVHVAVLGRGVAGGAGVAVGGEGAEGGGSRGVGARGARTGLLSPPQAARRPHVAPKLSWLTAFWMAPAASFSAGAGGGGGQGVRRRPGAGLPRGGARPCARARARARMRGLGRRWGGGALATLLITDPGGAPAMRFSVPMPPIQPPPPCISLRPPWCSAAAGARGRARRRAARVRSQVGGGRACCAPRSPRRPAPGDPGPCAARGGGTRNRRRHGGCSAAQRHGRQVPDRGAPLQRPGGLLWRFLRVLTHRTAGGWPRRSPGAPGTRARRR